MKKCRWIPILLLIALLVELLPSFVSAQGTVRPGESFTYSKEEHWGVEDGIWSWEWALADSTDFYQMSYTTVDGQGECYVADWELYPYCAARNGGINVHPNEKADAARVFTAPASGYVTVSVSVSRTSDMTVGTNSTPTSFRILLEDTAVYPTKGDYRILVSKEGEEINVQAFVKQGEKLRFVVGAMDNRSSDAVNLQTTVTYDSIAEEATETRRVGEVYTFTEGAWGKEDPHWSWEWTPAGKTTFSPMTWQYVEKYGREMYASDWQTHPYSYVDSKGEKLHPAETADTVKTFTVPYSGTVRLNTVASRYMALSDVSNSAANGTSLRILLNHTQVYPLYSNYLVLDSTTAKDFDLSLPVKQGDKLRIVIGGMGQVTSDAVKLYNTLTYTDLAEPEVTPGFRDTFSADEAQFAQNDMGNWSFEYRDSNDTFGPMTYQYVEKYGRYMYATDWTAHAYNYVDGKGLKLHPAKTRDTVKTFTAPYDGRIEMAVKVARSYEYVAEGSKNPTSLRIYKNNEQIWPTNGGEKELTSTTATTFRINADVRMGDKIRCVVGSMGNTTQDGVIMENTVTYTAVGLRELAAFMDQYNQRIDVIDVQGDKLNSAERAWSWKPTTALGFTDLATFNSPTDAKLRYSKSLQKYVVAVCSSRGFMGLVDFATGKKLWQVSLTGNPNPHAIEYLPNGNVAVAASLGNWIRIYTASQGSASTKYVEVTLAGAHGVLWDPDRKVLWSLGDEEIKAYTIGGSAAAPTLTEVSKYRQSVAGVNGHDLSPVYGNKDRLWVTSDAIYQYDIPTKEFVLTYEYGNVIARKGAKGISNFPDSHTTLHVFPNNTYLTHDSDRVFVTLRHEGKVYGMTHKHDTGAYYKVRSWISSYNSDHKIHIPETVPGYEPTCEAEGLTDGSQCSLCGVTMTAGTRIPSVGHAEVIDKAVPATCTADGLTEGQHCETCGEILLAQETVPATGHRDTTPADNRCDICGDRIKEAVLRFRTISLKGNIAINYYMDLSDEVAADENAYMLFTMEDGEQIKIPASEGEYSLYQKAYYYSFSCAVSAKEMTDTVLCQFFWSGGQTEVYTYSVKTYADRILASSTSAKLRNLIYAMLNYGAASQIHFEYHTERLANAGQEVPDYTQITIDGYPVNTKQGTTLATYAGASLLLTSETTLRIFFTVDKSVQETFTVTYKGKTLPLGIRSGKYYADIPDIGAKDLDEYFTLTVSDGSETAEVSYSPLSYCASIIENAKGIHDRELQDVAAAMYLYNQAANAYFLK